MVTVKVKKKMSSRKVKTSTVRFAVDVWGDERQTAKEAFELQNKERQKAGAKELEWSEELYQVAVARVEKDGFDGHKNFEKRMDEHFCMYGITTDDMILDCTENMCRGTGSPTRAIESWVNSTKGHYQNMINSDWQCGAIAYCEKNATWVAIFSSKPLSLIENWKTETVLLKVTRIDATTGEGVFGSVFSILDDTGKEIYRSGFNNEKSYSYCIWEMATFVPGKTYTLKEVSTPNGYKKAASVTFVARSVREGPTEIVLSSDKK